MEFLAGEAKNGNGWGFSSCSPWKPDVAVEEGKVCTVKGTGSHLWDEGGILRGWYTPTLSPERHSAKSDVCIL
jgi:hypothetical protein